MAVMQTQWSWQQWWDWLIGSVSGGGDDNSMFGTGDIKFQLPEGLTLDNQAYELNDQSATRSSVIVKDGKLTESIDPSVKTMYDNFKHGWTISRDGPCLGWRPDADSDYEWLTYDQVHERMKSVGSALAALKMSRDNEQRVFMGFYATNCVEWTLTALAAYTQNIVIVPLYDTLGAEACQFIINQTKMQAVLTDTYKRVNTLLSNMHNTPTLKHILVVQDIEGDEKDKAHNSKGEVTVTSYEEFERGGLDNSVGFNLPTADDLCIVCYTSGTTGLPKGVMLTHRQLLACPHAVMQINQQMGLDINSPGKTSISFLPLAHIFEQAIQVFMLYGGGRIGFFRGNVQTLLDDIKVLKPTLFPLVPRLLSRLYDKVQSNLSKAGYVGNWLFSYGFSSKLAKLKQGVITKGTFWDKLIFKKVQAELGGNVEVMITGAAPISAEVLEMCRVVLGCIILEGYGQTECGAACSVTIPGDAVAGHVGPPLPCNLIKLVDVPDMQYYAKDNRGEVCVKGPNVMSGYYNEPQKTAEAIDSDGWLHTGDVGEWRDNGTLKIIDRKKHIFKLAQGEYVAPEKIEQVFLRMPLVAQIFVDGISTQRFLVAIVVPDEIAIKSWAKSNGIPSDDQSMEQLCENASLKQHILTEMSKFGKANKLNAIEIVKAIHLSSEPFSVENDLLTPTLKSKRPQLRKYYADQIEKLYADNPM